MDVKKHIDDPKLSVEELIELARTSVIAHCQAGARPIRAFDADKRELVGWKYHRDSKWGERMVREATSASVDRVVEMLKELSVLCIVCEKHLKSLEKRDLV